MDTALLWPAALTALLVIGAVSDMRTRRLPNWLCLALLVLGLVYAYYLGGFALTGWHFAHAMIAMVIGAGIFAAGIMGAGDAKFYAGLRPWASGQAGVGALPIEREPLACREDLLAKLDESWQQRFLEMVNARHLLVAFAEG